MVTMVKRILFVLALLAWVGAGLGQGRVLEDQTFDSAALGGPMEYTVYLPEGYESDARRYPVVTMLHGYGGADTDWVRYGAIDRTADRLIAEGELPPVIIVMPDAGNSYYVDSEQFGAYATAIADDLVEHVDATYRTIPERSARVIGGLSMGGYGAAYLAFNNLDTFAAAGVMSGALFADEPPEDRPALTGEPFDPETWEAHDVFNAIDQVAESEDRCGWPPPSEICMSVYINAGDDDQLGLHRDALLFYDALVEAEIPTELRIGDGDHAWPFWADTVGDVLVFFADVMERYY